ncbi:uncharacterized protein LOC127866412 [Dreissena polymorpha]|uniref:F-box domain-containing protein n=1 Tax=Dreissena polymorpha TaxID=45954 RepID=A0A9D4LQA5_DREPO|nr:uncharacterized protein LOC127866412 [Dreissena polymorpha]XP_052262877.1 uncharacterized protein LOC127866412 [Dreissena polymorpha]KAH3863032.1 hypothetical protein DPMN_026008 [Dreissena polymorpha]
MNSPQSSSRNGNALASIEGIPSVVATQILGYLTWDEKLTTAQVLSTWKPHMHTPRAWPVVKYNRESEENVYFVKEKRTKFLICLKIYGKFMRNIEISFGYIISRSGQQILHAIADNCSMLRYFRLGLGGCQEFSALSELALKRNDVAAIISILRLCKDLDKVGLISPYICWSDSGTNLLTELCETRLSTKITELRLMSLSLTDHDDYLTLLQDFSRLQMLTVRREKINNTILLQLVANGLQEICLYQDEELALVDARQLREDVWSQVLKINPNFKVDLVLQYILVIKDSFVTNMPLRSLVLDDLVNIVTKGVMDHLVSCYKLTLERFTYTNLYLENFESGDSRMPAALITLATLCQKLHTIRYGFPLSSTTILILVKTRRLKELLIPSVEVSYEFDWPIQEQWEEEFVRWLEANHRSEDLLEAAVSQVLGRPWKLQYENGLLERSVSVNM